MLQEGHTPPIRVQETGCGGDLRWVDAPVGFPPAAGIIDAALLGALEAAKR